MNDYIIDAIAPLVFRSGKPFGSQADASDANFPLPSSSAGLIRSQYLQQHGILLSDAGEQNRGKLSEDVRQQLLDIQVQGAFLVRFDTAHPEDYTLMVPKPASALYFKAEAKDADSETAKTKIVRLSPKAFDDTVATDLPDGLLPVQMQEHIKGKPQKGAQYWCWKHFQQWQQGQKVDFDTVKAMGVESIPTEIRTHVAIDNQTLSAQEGKLFQTAGLDFQTQRKAGHNGWQDTQLGFLIRTSEPLNKDVVRFGGESRLSYLLPLQQSNAATLVPAELFDSIEKSKRLCMTLLTPAIFANGYLPAWLNADTLEGTLPHTQTKVRLKSVAVDRWQPVSGWDLHQFKPKAMRKAVSAGAMYWFEVISEQATDIDKLWFASVSDDAQDQKDGFGVVSIHAWQS